MTAFAKVLVVDDDPVVRKSFDRVLSSKGYAVITAESGEDALRKLNEEKYDVVYTDLRMPGISGLEVAEEVKARKPWTPVVIITGYGSDAAEARAKAAGVSSFLHKPLSPEMIEASARDAMATPAAAAAAAVLPVVDEAPVAEAPSLGRALANIALFFAAPFIGLAYMIALPFVGIGVVAMQTARAALKVQALRIMVAPLAWLAYIVVFPFIGLAWLAWLGGRALTGVTSR
jgi:CheY-like chemotaxis protein